MDAEKVSPADPEPDAEASKDGNVEQLERVTGVNLVILLSSLSLACLLLMLDTSVVSTVSHSISNKVGYGYHGTDQRCFTDRLSQRSHTSSIPPRRRLVRERLLAREVCDTGRA